MRLIEVANAPTWLAIALRENRSDTASRERDLRPVTILFIINGLEEL